MSFLWDREPSLWEMAQQTIDTNLIPAGDPQPIGSWIEGTAINLSNQSIKAGLWGPADRLTISLGKTDVWDRRTPFPAALTLKELQDGFMDPSNIDRPLPGDGHYVKGGGVDVRYRWMDSRSPCSKPVGQVVVMAPDFLSTAQPEAHTELHTGITHVEMKSTGARLHLEFLSSMTGNIMAVRGSARGLTNPIEFRLTRHHDTGNRTSASPDNLAPELSASLPPPSSGSDGKHFWIQQQFPADPTFPGGFQYVLMGVVAGKCPAVSVQSAQRGLGTPAVGIDDSRIRFAETRNWRPDYSAVNDALGEAVTVTAATEGNDEFTVIWTVVSSNDGDDVVGIARRRLEQVERLGFNGLRRRNLDWYRGFYAKREQGRVFTGEADAGRLWLKRTFRSWTCIHSACCKVDPSRYEGDAVYAWLNYDAEMWHNSPCYNDIYDTPWQSVLNRDDRCDRWTGLFKEWFPTFQKNAREVFGLPGMYIGHGYIPPIKGGRYPHIHDVWEWCIEIPAQTLKPLWDRWEYGGDVSFLRNHVFKPLRELAIFYCAYVSKQNDGKYHVVPTCSAEHWGLRWGFSINHDSPSSLSMIRWTLRNVLASSELLGRDAKLRARWRQVLDGLADYPSVQTEQGLIFTDLPGIDPRGTMYNHFAALLPALLADEIHIDSPLELQQTMLRTVKMINAWHNHDVPYLFGESSDVSMACLSWFQKLHESIPLDSAMHVTQVMEWEPERLINSRSGRIHLFPAPPPTDVAFRGFQAKGGFLVDAQRVSGVVSGLSISSRRNGVCRVVNPWPGLPARVCDHHGNSIEVMDDDYPKPGFSWQAAKGLRYLIEPIDTK